MNAGPKKIAAFTVFELTVVLALLSTIITIISVALNRFNEQLRGSTDVHAELNEWFAFRANLWNELYHADSVTYQNAEVRIFRQGKSIDYRASSEILERKSGQEWISTGMEIGQIEKEEEAGAITFHFLWKDEMMKLSYQSVPRVKEQIDRYFEATEDEPGN